MMAVQEDVVIVSGIGVRRFGRQSAWKISV